MDTHIACHSHKHKHNQNLREGERESERKVKMMLTMWMSIGIIVVPLLGWLLWWWNDLWYYFVVKHRCSNTKLPLGRMGLPIIGEMLHFLWYFKVVRRPDEYINSKRRKYGDGVGLYKSHLFGTPCVIACSSLANKFIFKSDQSFILEWPNVDILGKHSLVAVQGPAHVRLRSFVLKSINQPDALSRISLMVQPLMISTLQSWANRDTITASNELKKMTFENIGKYFASFEPGTLLDSLNDCLIGMSKGVRAFRVNVPGTAYHHGLQCRKKAMHIFREELKKRKKREKDSSEPITDILDGLMRLKDDEGKELSKIEVLDNIVSLLWAGYASTAFATMWALYYLAKYPKVLHKLQEETMSLRKSKKEDLVSSEEILKLKYTHKVVEETIRLANVAPFIFRTATEDVEYKGYKIPKGWKVILWLRYLHTDAENFDDPMCFDPDRWDGPNKPEAYKAFGGGIRLCAGNMLARLQVSTFLYYLTTGYKWELVNPNAKIGYLPHPAPVDGVQITVHKL